MGEASRWYGKERRFMSDLEHPAAVYYDKGGRWHDMAADKLIDDGKFRDAQEAAERGQLWDPGETISLSVKSESTDGKCRHFSSKSGKKSNLKVYGVGGEEGAEKTAHDERVVDLLSQLESSHTLPWVTEGMAFNDYQWGKEVWRTYTPEVLARHDLYGQWRGLNMSTRRPAVIVEVINSHYPEPPLLEALFGATRQLPLVVFFEFVGRGGRFFRLSKKGEPDVWARAFMWKGWAHVFTAAGKRSFDTSVSFLEELRRERDSSSS